MTNRWRSGGLLLLAGSLALVVGAGGLRAQSEKLTGSAELGWRSFFDRPNAQQLAKFEEYRDMSPGPFLQSLRLRYQPGDSAARYELTAANAFRLDQTFAGRAHKPGLFDLRLGWDRIPHTFSTDARMPAGAGTSPPFLLPGSFTHTLADTTLWRQSPYLDPVRSKWDVAQGSLTLTPGTSNDLKVDFTNISKSGDRPLSMSLNAVSLYREFLEPIDQNVRDLKLSESYVRQRYQVQVAYDLNAFDNANSSVLVNNPLVATSSTAGSSVGRAALPPSNLAQTFTVAGGLNLPFRTRVNSTLSYSKRSQNEPFIPYTSNTALTDPRLATEPASLNGDVRTLLANITATTHPVRDVSITARYRYWDFNDRTQPFTPQQIPVEVTTDRSIAAIPDSVVGQRYPYTKQNAALELHWRPVPLAGVEASYGWERWDHGIADMIEIVTSNEWTPRLALDLAPAGWISIRGSVSHSQRRNDGYADGTLNDNFNGFRRFNWADRDRDATDLLAQFSPTDRFAFSTTYTVGHDSYPSSSWGVQDDRNTEVGSDVSYMANQRLTVFASYTYEIYRLGELNKYRDGQNPNNPTYDYRIAERDLMQTFGAGLTGTLVPKKLDVEARLDYARGATFLGTTNPLTPVAQTGTPTQQASSVLNATATDFPEITHAYTPFHLSLRYNVNANWSGTVGFNHEEWESSDFRTNNLGTLIYSSPVTPIAVSGFPLGNQLLPYRANYLTFTIGFRPSLSRVARPIL